MAAAPDIDDLRARLALHGYHVFLRPDRPSGWLVTLRNGEPGPHPPIEARAATREDAVLMAERLFVTRRLTELDHRIRAAGLTPPFWGGGGQASHLDALLAFAGAHSIS